MDISYMAQIFPYRKLTALARTIHTSYTQSVHEEHGTSRFVERPVEKGRF